MDPFGKHCGSVWELLIKVFSFIRFKLHLKELRMLSIKSRNSVSILSILEMLLLSGEREKSRCRLRWIASYNGIIINVGDFFLNYTLWNYSMLWYAILNLLVCWAIIALASTFSSIYQNQKKKNKKKNKEKPAYSCYLFKFMFESPTFHFWITLLFVCELSIGSFGNIKFQITSKLSIRLSALNISNLI